MIQLILFLLIGALLFLSLFFLARRSAHPEGGAQVLLEARQALNTLQNGLLPPEMAERIFAKEDFACVLASGSSQVRELFLKERKRIALCWVNQVRTHILRLRQFHLGVARHYSRLSFRTEANLALEFVFLLGACRALQVALYLRGPYAAPSIVGAMAGAAAKVCDISERSLGFLRASEMGTFAARN